MALSEVTCDLPGSLDGLCDIRPALPLPPVKTIRCAELETAIGLGQNEITREVAMPFNGRNDELEVTENATSAP